MRTDGRTNDECKKNVVWEFVILSVGSCYIQWRILVNGINWRGGFHVRWSTLQTANGLSPWLLERGFISGVLYEKSWLCAVNWKGTLLLVGCSRWIFLWKRDGSLVCHEQASSPCSVWRKSRQGFLNVMTDVPMKIQVWFLLNKNENICVCRQRRYLDSSPNTFQLLVQRRCRAMTKRVCLFARYELMWNIRRRNEWFMAGRTVVRGAAAQRGGFSSGVFAQSLKADIVNRMFVVVFRHPSTF